MSPPPVVAGVAGLHTIALRAIARWPMAVCALVFFSGLAALSWEIVWQIHAALAIGVSAMGAAITLVATMAGMAVGSLGAGRWLRSGTVQAPGRLYAGLEIVIGVSGALWLHRGFALLERLDAAIYLEHP